MTNYKYTTAFVFAMNAREKDTKKPLKGLGPIINAIEYNSGMSQLTPQNPTGAIGFAKNFIPKNQVKGEVLGDTYREITGIYPVAHCVDERPGSVVGNGYYFSFFKRDGIKLDPYVSVWAPNDKYISKDYYFNKTKCHRTSAGNDYLNMGTNQDYSFRIDTSKAKAEDAFCNMVTLKNVQVDNFVKDVEIKFAFGVTNYARLQNGELTLPKILYKNYLDFVKFDDQPTFQK